MKTEILTMLREAEGYISGQNLCNYFGVSRTAIWKVMNQLKEDGYKIEAVQNRGYRIVNVPDVLYESELKSRMKTAFMGQKVYYFDSLDSTNIYAKKIADEEAEGTLVVADAQQAGKGSRGRGWESSPGEGIWMTVILKPDIQPSDASRLTLVMALSVVRACEQYLQIPLQIKWPNDIVCNGKKVCGILTEMSAELNYINYIVIGIGINVNIQKFSEELELKATSFYKETGKKINRAGLVALIMKYFEEDYQKFLQTRDLRNLLDDYTKHSVTIGSDIKVLDRKGNYTGKALGVNQEGHLLVQREDGTQVTVLADEVSVRGMCGYV